MGNFFTRNPVFCIAHPGRSWSATRAMKKHLETYSECQGCGTKESLQVHHIAPVHVDPARAADPDNFITLCMTTNRCHLVVGHAGNWKRWVSNVMAVAPRFREAFVWRRIMP